MICLFLLLKKSMIGSRVRILLLGWFFTFAFAMLLLALIQNYANAETGQLDEFTQTSVLVSGVSPSDVQNTVEYELIPSFWVEHGAPWFDFETDDSLQKYLSDEHPFFDASYVPIDLLPIDSNFTANNAKAFKLREEAGIQFADMARHFRNTFSGDRLRVASAYRSSWLQWYLIKQWCALFKCAKVGTSEHQAWLAVDIKVITKWGRAYSLDAAYPNKYFDRLKANAASFGFHNTYQKGVEIDGKMIEWRHRRYVGTELATILMENNQTFAEYYNKLMKN